jgi:hypothetical protein
MKGRNNPPLTPALFRREREKTREVFLHEPAVGGITKRSAVDFGFSLDGGMVPVICEVCSHLNIGWIIC